MTTECGFYAVNGKHCVINSHCVVCKAQCGPEIQKLKKDMEITLKDFGALDGTYKITDLKNGTLSLEFLRI